MSTPTTGVPDGVAHPSRIRTYTPRYRLSPLTRERMATLLPDAEITDLPLDREAAFGRLAPLVLEIGSGHGAAAIGYAAAHPEHDVLAAEVHLPGVVRMLAAARAAGVGNLRVWAGDALALLDRGLEPGSVAAIHLLFPDPWPKAKHAKRRFVQKRNLTLLHTLLQPGGRLLIATDHPVYRTWVRAQLAEFPGFDAADVARPEWKDPDGFEGKALAAGRPSTYFSCVKRPAAT